MPGYSQLKKLSEDVLVLGNEPKLRADRGEKVLAAQIPQSIPDINDSEDFVMGLPVTEDENIDTPSDDSDNLESLGDMASGDVPSVEDIINDTMSEASNGASSAADLDLDSLLNLGGEAEGEPDLSAFETPASDTSSSAEEVLEPSIADMNLDDLLKPSASSEESIEEPPVDEKIEESPLTTPEDIPVDFNTDSLSDMSLEEPIVEPETPNDLNADFEDAATPSLNDDFGDVGKGIDLNLDLPEEITEGATSNIGEDSAEESPAMDEMPSMDEPIAEPIPSMDDMPSIDEPLATPDNMAETSDSKESSNDELPDFQMPDMSGLFDNPEGTAPDEQVQTTSEDDSINGESANPEEGNALADELSMNTPVDENQPIESFDTSEMDGIDFSMPDNPDAPASSSGEESVSATDFDIPETDSQLAQSHTPTDFELSSDIPGTDFEIPGFSDADADPFGADGKIKLQTPDFSNAIKGDNRQKNTLTNEEYKRFKTNLFEYPLNVRLAVEEMIAKNEFTDETIFEVIEKIIKKVSVRQLASHLEKTLDIHLEIPRDFERRTAKEYEAYKSSIEYQLKNRIIPTAILSVVAAIFVFCCVYLFNYLVYRPAKAESLYKEGYALLENNAYPQSEMKFNEALTFKAKKKWFFTYAQGYRRYKQYNRAEVMYKALLKRYDHDKKAGLEYVDMTLNDLREYEKAEQLCLREVLDYHVNDKDAILQLGDVYLEWATEKDSTKFDNAKAQYSTLIQLYGQTDLYASRMMRYYVRTDSLREVIQLKDYFYPREKAMGTDDWTEMSGYLMDKLYGYISPTDEYLRNSIEDVRDMLKIAEKTGPNNPIASYNLARYFVQIKSHNDAKNKLESALQKFAKAPSRKPRDLYKEINAHRLLGEEYVFEKEYINARKTYADGINLFETERHDSGFESDKNVGILYSDMGDLDYFLYGDLDEALRNYENAIANKNDNPSIDYRAGYIKYGKNDYDDALNYFLKSAEEKNLDPHLMLALANTFSLRNDNYASQGYYDRLLEKLNVEKELHRVIDVQSKPETVDILETAMKATNNLGVTYYKLARQTGSSEFNGKAIVNFSDSIVAWDRLTRNQETLVRLGGSNLAQENLSYVTRPISTYEPAIYTEIPRVLYGEKGLER